ncbi:MAG: hypothetical protein JNM17_13560 [Archangium sp.]|nr:hypothetical protein [Archangium sp.]
MALIAACLLGYLLQLSNGTLHPEAFNLTCVVLVLATFAAFLRDRTLVKLEAPALGLVFIGLVVIFGIHFTTAPGVYLRVGGDAFIEHHKYAVAGALLAGAAFAARKWQPFIVVGVLIVYAFLGVWLLKASPAPMIDVWYWHKAGYEALAAGTNPYGIWMPNIYGHTQWFAPGLADAQHVFVGYPYPPVTMLLGWLGHLAKADYRYFNLVAQLGAGAFLAFTRPGRVAMLACIVFLFTPRGLFVLEQGWTEATSSLAITACVCVAVRWPKALPWVFGLMLGVKQYFVFALPLLPLLLGTYKPRELGKFLLKAAILPAIITLPFLLWSPGAFFNSVVAFQAKQPFRADALSVMAWLAQNGGPMLPLNLSFLLAGGAAGLSAWKSEKSASAFSAALALTLLFFFFFAKQAFTNYYYLILACLCAAAAAGGAALVSGDRASSKADTASPT